MKDEDIISVANMSGWDANTLEDGFGSRLKRFAEIVSKKERENCAVTVWSTGMDLGEVKYTARDLGAIFSKAIRERGSHE